MLKPARLTTGDRVSVVAPASPFQRDAFDAGLAELVRLGFVPTYDETVFARQGYVAGTPVARARALGDAWDDPSAIGVIGARGGYGSVQLLPWLDSAAARRARKVFIGGSDLTSLLVYLTTGCGVVAFHGPMVAGTLAQGTVGYDASSFVACLTRPEPLGVVGGARLETLNRGEAVGVLLGGTLTQLLASFGTPHAFDPPPGYVLFLDEVNERPYRVDRMLVQLRLSGLLARASAVVFGELPGCDEPGGQPAIRDVVGDLMREFPGPVLFGLPAGHSTEPCLTLPLGVLARVIANDRPRLVIEEAAVA